MSKNKRKYAKFSTTVELTNSYGIKTGIVVPKCKKHEKRHSGRWSEKYGYVGEKK